VTIGRLLQSARKLKLILATASYRRALRLGVAAATEHQHDPLPPDIRTVLDVGANRGQFALVALERWPHARLVCFEPLPGPRALLARVLRNKPQAEIVATALGSKSGIATIHVSRADDSSSLLAPTERQSKTFPGTKQVATIEVPTARLDEYFDAGLAAPALLKIDVQGLELEVLRGGTRVLKSVDAVLVECSFFEFYSGQARADDVVRFLHEHGFSLTSGTAPSLDRHGVVQQLDLIFYRRERPVT
jgi:FkbM family methyltransferase